MEKVKKIPPQEASQTNPVAKPEDTKGRINNKVSKVSQVKIHKRDLT